MEEAKHTTAAAAVAGNNDIKNSNKEKKEERYMGIAIIHSQVRKIKQEIEEIDSYQQPPEISRRINPRRRQQRSRSPLGLTARPIITVGNM
ncbi:uncharacterized protein LOC124936804 [Impatiens glandulifera]|uniref:uncharacterized protein LOC124936804 n=1 Tax=Impatiens glandulifera TaxID=253017 RepID=UPI001FB0ACC8|nr:uncharacterized protein LOC124936804 [Impatiens glandulifera]